MCVLVTITVVPMAMAGAYVSIEQYEQQRTGAEAKLIEQAQSVASFIDREVERALAVAQILAGSAALRSGDLDNFRLEAQVAQTALTTSLDKAAQPIVIAAFSHDASRLLTLGVPERPRRSKEVSETVQRAIDNGQPQISNLFIGSSSGIPRIEVVAPVRADPIAADTPTSSSGAVAILLPPEHLLAIALSASKLTGIDVNIRDRTGVTIARYPFTDLVGKLPRTPGLLEAILDRNSGLLQKRSTRRDGSPGLVAFARAQRSGYIVVLGISEPIMLAPLKASLAQQVLGGGTVLLLGATLALVLARNTSRAFHRVLPIADQAVSLGRPAETTGILEADVLTNEIAQHLAGRQRAEMEQAWSHEQLAQALEKAAQANRARSRFLAGMSHELRTPLNGILGYAQLLHIEGGLTDTQATRVDAMLGAGKHLLQMITCVLDLSEIEADRLEVAAVELDLWAVAEACMDLIRPAAEAKGLALSISAEPGTPRTLVADATRLRQILLNLLGNAAKFTGHGAITLHLRHSTDAAALRIEVADTGPGITDEQCQRLFMDFERLDTEGTRAVEGAGLGLALSYRLAEVMGGRLGHDNNPGGGSLFWLELPLDTIATAIPGLTLAANGLDDAPAFLPLRPLQILVVDDVLMNREIAAGFLRTANHTVICVEGGAEAVVAVASTDFDLVLMDVRMPEMDGLEATRRIRAIEGKRGKLPILALTAHAFTEHVADCRRAGMDGHLAKPFDLSNLLEAVARTLAAGNVSDEEPKVGGNEAATVAPGVAALAAPVIDPEQPVLDTRTFKQTAGFLKPESVVDYLQTIATLGQNLLGMLNATDALLHDGDALAATAHTLAGSAGMFGFGRVSAKARLFERAVLAGSADGPALADALKVAIAVTDQAILAAIRNTARPDMPAFSMLGADESVGSSTRLAAEQV